MVITDLAKSRHYPGLITAFLFELWEGNWNVEDISRAGLQVEPL